MNTEIYVVTLDELKALAAPFERKISRQWVSKYARLGLLPSHNPPGLGTGKGRQNLYSRALANQLVPLILAIKRHGKNLDAVGWDIWWQGYFARPVYWRDPLQKAAANWDLLRAAVPASEEREEETYKRIEETSELIRERKDVGRLFGAVKRHRPDELTTFLAIIITVLNGSYIPLSDVAAHDEHGVDLNEELLSKTLSIPIHAAGNSNPQTRFATDVTSLDQQLHNLSQLLDVGISDFVSSHNDEQIELARSEIALLMWVVSQVEKSNQEKFGQSSGAKPILWSNQTQEGQANMLIAWLYVRRDPTMRKSIAMLNAQINELMNSTQAAKNDT